MKAKFHSDYKGLIFLNEYINSVEASKEIINKVNILDNRSRMKNDQLNESGVKKCYNNFKKKYSYSKRLKL